MYKYGDKIKIKSDDPFYRDVEVYVVRVSEYVDGIEGDPNATVGYIYGCIMPVKNTTFYKELDLKDTQLEGI